MSNNKTAIREYVRVVYKLHKMTMEKLDYFINLPSIKCESLKNIGKSDNIIIDVYKLNGYMKYNILTFYHEYVKDLYSFINDYCEKYNIDKPPLDTDMWIFNYEIKSTLQLVESKVETNPVVNDFTNQEIIDTINTLFESIALLITLEERIRSFTNYERLDLLEGRSFKFLRSNQLFDRIQNLFNSYPQSGHYNTLKTSFITARDKLIR
jgi:hypothetical protein